MLRALLTCAAFVACGLLAGATITAAFGPVGVAAGSILGSALAVAYLYANRRALTAPPRVAVAFASTRLGSDHATDEAPGMLLSELLDHDELLSDLARLDAIESTLATLRDSLDTGT